MIPKEWVESFPGQVQQLLEEFAYAVGGPLTGFNLHPGQEGWMLVIKTRSVQRGALVAFYAAYSPEACVANLLYDLHHSPGITWSSDKYAK